MRFAGPYHKGQQNFGLSGCASPSCGAISVVGANGIAWVDPLDFQQASAIYSQAYNAANPAIDPVRAAQAGQAAVAAAGFSADIVASYNPTTQYSLGTDSQGNPVGIRNATLDNGNQIQITTSNMGSGSPVSVVTTVTPQGQVIVTQPTVLWSASMNNAAGQTLQHEIGNQSQTNIPITNSVGSNLSNVSTVSIPTTITSGFDISTILDSWGSFILGGVNIPILPTAIGGGLLLLLMMSGGRKRGRYE